MRYNLARPKGLERRFIKTITLSEEISTLLEKYCDEHGVKHSHLIEECLKTKLKPETNDS